MVRTVAGRHEGSPGASTFAPNLNEFFRQPIFTRAGGNATASADGQGACPECKR
jgi:hypothetical protein